MKEVTAGVISGKRDIKLQITDIQDLNAGTELHSVIKAKLGRRDLSFIERIYDVYGRNLIWQHFKDIGLPVVPTFRRCEDRSSSLETDLRRKWPGCEIYGKSDMHSLYGYPLSFKKDRQVKIDKKFLELTEEKEFGTIRDQANKYSDMASKNRSLLPIDDAFELIVHENGLWQLIILDLTYAKVLTQQEVTNPKVFERMIKSNTGGTEEFLGNLIAIRKKLIKINSKT